MKIKEEPTRYLHRVLEIVESAGYDTGPFISRLSLNRKQLADPKARISYDGYVGVLKNILAGPRIEALALRVGLNTRLVDHGILGYAFISSDNLRTGMKIFSKYQKIQGPLVNVRMYQEGNEGVYTCERVDIDIDGGLYRFAVEDWLGETTHIGSLFDQQFVFNSVRLGYSQPRCASRYRDLFRCKIHFDQDCNEVRFPARFLDMPFSLAEPSVTELCIQQCEDLLKQMDSRPDIVGDVRRVILGRPGKIPKLEEVASEIFMSSRTLRRRLYNAGTSFREVVSDVRMRLAIQYLKDTSLPTAEIAYLLGYSDVTAFYRSFRKTYSETPTTYRNRLNESANENPDSRTGS
jgi:AraC-like DNA-binding protein